MFNDDDDIDFFGSIEKELSTTTVSPPDTSTAIAAAMQMGGDVLEAVTVVEQAVVESQTMGTALQETRRLLNEVPGLRFVPVRNRKPIVEGFTAPSFWSRPMVEMIDAWQQKEYTRGSDFALLLGDDCGDGGNVVVEADNQVGEDWLKANLPPTPVTTLTRMGFLHRHYRVDLKGRGNRIDLFGSVRKHKEEAAALGYKVELPKLPRGQKHTPEQIAFRDAEMERALAEVPMGPVIDIKANGGQAMAPGGSTPKAPGFRYQEGGGRGSWAREWGNRPVFDPEWFPESVWVREALADIATSGSAIGYDRDYWTSEKREAAAMHYASRMKPSMAGEGAHAAFLRNAILVCRGFDLEVAASRRVLTYWAQVVCAHDPWDAKEIEHKLKEAHTKGREAMGYKLAQRRGDETAGERYAAMMRALAEDKMSAEIEAEIFSDLIFDMEAMAGIKSEAPVEGKEPDEVQTAPTKGNAPIAPTIDNVQADAGEEQVLKEYGIQWADVKSNPMMGVHFTRVDGKVAKFPPTTLNLAQFFMNSRMFKSTVSGIPAIRLNKMNNEIEFNGEPLESIHVLKTRIDTLFQMEVPKERIEDALETVGLHQRYDPSIEEFERLPKWDGVERLHRITQEILPVEEKSAALSSIKLRKTVLGMVARSLNPGCKLDTITILMGDQGALKSTFWKTLAGAKFFSDTAIAQIGGRDEMWLISRFRVIEMAEIESMYSKAENSQLKAFFSRTHDTYRLPYARRQVTVPRRSIIVGSTNEEEILSDPTGSRRYWPIPVTGEVNVELLEKWRDQLLAEAVHFVKKHLVADALGQKHSQDYIRGMWWMDKKEDVERATDSMRYQQDDPWRATVEEFVSKETTPFLVSDVLGKLGVPVERCTRRESNRVITILTNMRCQRENGGKASRHGGRTGKFWTAPLDADMPF